MHSDLSPHLHTEECNILSEKLKECHDTNKFLKFFGACNDSHSVLWKCLMRERAAHQKKNFEEGERRRAAMRKRMAEMESAE